MLYIFAGFPKSGLHAGGLRFSCCACEACCEERGGEPFEAPLALEHGKDVHYRKEGVFSGDNPKAEWLYPVEYQLSDRCLQDGITWDWFPENWAFGNGVTVHKTSASPEYKTVVHGTDLNLDQFLSHYGVTRLAEVELERMHIRHEGWQKYEARWTPGTCPQESHIVHLTWLVTTHALPPFAYERLRQIIEDPTGQLKEPERYSQESGKHFSAIRQWDGQSAHHAGVAS